MNIRDVNLDERRPEFGARITQRHRGVGQCTRIQHDGLTRIGGVVDPAQQLGLAVALPDQHVEAEVRGLAFDQSDEIVMGGAAVDLGLTLAEPAQVWTVDHVDPARHETAPISEYAATSSDGSGPSRRPGLASPSSTTKRSTPERFFLSPAMYSSSCGNASES